MTSRILLVLSIAISLIGFSAAGDETINGLPLHVKKLSDNAIRLWVGDYISSTAVAALKTDKGIVVIDSTEVPLFDKHFRKIIAKEFGSNDFVYLINTHEHADHTTGNGVYSDCEIIAHDYCAEGMRANKENQQRSIDWLTEYLPELEGQLAEAEKGSDEYKQTAEDIILRELRLKTLTTGVELTYPTKTFADTLKLDMGNMTIELFAVGGVHTASDIFVLVPEEGLLFTGDMLADEWYTDTPGCLQSFGMRVGMKRDVPRLLKNWEKLIARKAEIEQYLPAHWNGGLSYEGFVARHDYVESLYAGVAKTMQAGGTITDMMTDFNLEKKFPELAGSPGFTRDFVHYGSIAALWADETGAVSASNALGTLIEEKGLELAVAEISKAHQKKSDKYYFLEGEFNGLGYRYLGEDKLEEAVAVFKLNVQMNPESWNTYDSLAEAYMKSGENTLAVRNYEKSIEMNPENENGIRMLEEINTATAQK